MPLDTQVDDWVVVHHIGHGGYGEVYHVVSYSGRVDCAMKVEYHSAKK